MRRAMFAAALVAAVIAVIAAIVAEATRTVRPAPAAAHRIRPGQPTMADAAAIDSLREVAGSGAGQARTLHTAVRRCRTRAAPGRCVLLALGNAAAGAKLSETVLRAVAVRLPAGPCTAIASRLAGLVSTIAYLGTDGIRNVATPGVTWAAARASARVGTRIIAIDGGSWPRRCAGGGAGLRA